MRLPGAALALLVGVAAPLQPGWAAPLTLDEVIATVDARVPKLAQLDAKVLEAEAKALALRGAFDPVLAVKATQELLGPYPTTTTDAALGWTSPLGPGLEVGWRYGAGDFAVYDGKYQTLDQGELRLGLTVPLLQDLGMSSERAKVLMQDQAAGIAAAERSATAQELAGKAAALYAKWAAAGEKVELARAQLGLAEARMGGIQRQVEEGGLPRVEAVDNARAVASRRAELREAEADLGAAALALSLLLRDAQMRPVVPAPDRLPPRAPPAAPPAGVELEALAAAAVKRRPDLVAIDLLEQSARVDRQRAVSKVLPAVDLAAGLAQDRGAGDPKLGKTEVDLGLQVKLPVALREGRGELARAEAALARVDALRRDLVDTLRAELETGLLQREAAYARWLLMDEAVRAAEEVARLEGRAFALGSSDLFKLTKREETAAKERKAEIEARMELALTEARLRTLTAAWATGGGAPP